MKQFRIFLLVLLSVLSAEAQLVVNPYVIRGTDQLLYTDIPAPPAFGSTTTIDAAVVGHTLESAETEGNTDILIPATYSQRLQPNDLVGTAAIPYRFKSVSDLTRSWIGGDVLTASQQVLQSIGTSDFNYFYHLGLIGDSDTTVNGISGAAFSAMPSPGSFYELIDMRIKNMFFAGMFINDGTVDEVYGSLVLKFIAIDGYDVEGEGMYLGNTAGTESRFLSTIIENGIITNKGRDGFQVNNHADLNVSNLTIYNVGKQSAQPLNQRNLVQVQNSNGIIENSLAWGSPHAWNISTHGVTFRNFYFYITEANQGFIGQAVYPGSPQLNGGPLVFDRCHFGSSAPIEFYTEIREDNVDVMFINCTKDPNVENIYLDNRADKATKQIIEQNTTVVASITPTFRALNIDNEVNHGKITSRTHHDRGIGWLTPPPVEVEPTIQSSNIDISRDRKITLTRGNGENVLVLAHVGGPVDATPTDGITYTSSSTFGSGEEIGVGNFVIHNGPGNVGQITGLTDGQDLHIRAFEYNGTDYLTTTTTGNPINETMVSFILSQVFTAISSDFLDWTFASGIDGAAFTGGTNNGSWGDPAIGFTNPPTLNTSRSAMRLTRANGESIKFSKPVNYTNPHEIALVLELIGPSSATVRNLHTGNVSGTAAFLTINASEQLSVNGVNTGVTLPENTKFALRVHIENGIDASFVQVNTNAKVTFTTTVNNGVGTVWFGSKHDVNSSFDGYFWALAAHQGTVSDLDWANVVSDYIP